MNQRAEDLMMGAPSEVGPKQLRELHIRLNLPPRAQRGGEVRRAVAARVVDDERRDVLAGERREAG
jgi:hypothetical protein